MCGQKCFLGRVQALPRRRGQACRCSPTLERHSRLTNALCAAPHTDRPSVFHFAPCSVRRKGEREREGKEIPPSLADCRMSTLQQAPRTEVVPQVTALWEEWEEGGVGEFRVGLAVFIPKKINQGLCCCELASGREIEEFLKAL